jgi:hypothetical protein
MLASLQNENVGGFEDLLFRSEVREGTSTIMNPLLVEASVGLSLSSFGYAYEQGYLGKSNSGPSDRTTKPLSFL